MSEANKKSEVALREEAMQAFWVEHDIFQKSLETPAGGKPVGDFVFYDGPPFATGLPHYGHILASAIKDAIPRFWTMNGYHVRRQWGWDCHGLPLENLIEKKLGLSNKRDIEDFGIKNFNEAARNAVMEFRDDWKQIIPRMGRWADMENDYKTMDSTYTESVWWVFNQLNEKELVFEGFKSMHLCPRCGTTLSNFEVNLGYKDIKDIAVTVRLPLVDDKDGAALLVWTTTPWTLPGNLAAAVHEDYTYVKVKVTAEDKAGVVILAKERLEQLDTEEYEIMEELKGSDLVGQSYEPPFAYLKDQELKGKENAWKVYHADYVELGSDGTGAVHLAPAYGEDDLLLAQREGVPIFHHVDYEGRFKDFVTDFAGQLVKPKDDDDAGVTHMDADIEIVKALKENGRLFRKENITHSYPHCWRDDTPLLNYATTSWFVDVPKIKDELVGENEKVHWVPEHVGKNRFGKWLDGARDWAVSRQRYWGAPLPIWRHPEKPEEYKIFGSLDELKAQTPHSGNEYIMMRHGEAESNLKSVISANKDNDDHVTENGKKQVEEAIRKLPEKIDLIIHSGFARTKETAELVAAAYPDAELVEDDRIRELDIADSFEGKSWDVYRDAFETWDDRYDKEIPGSENRLDVQVRAGEFIYDLEVTHSNKRILIVSHAGTLFALECAAKGLSRLQAKDYFEADGSYLKNAELRDLRFVPIPHNDTYELDFHRPYIDEHMVEVDGVTYERVPDVFDCWFESGSMPYGQYHYPFSCEDTFEKELFPADFIAEGLDQTRGWFYSLIVLGTALFDKSPYKNVIVNGLVMAEDGKKMSKSLNNYPDPMMVANTAGADAMRFYLLSSPIVRGEDLNFSEKGVQELQRKNIGRLHNVLTMYKQYAGGESPKADSKQVLDAWIISRTNELIVETTKGYKNYELDRATRPITDFIDDLSVWYLRRSRDRLKGDDAADKQATLETLRYVLQNLSLVMAPVMPFYAEYLWQEVKGEKDAESVHLGAWPEEVKPDTDALETMKQVREAVSLALEQRAKAKIKNRQPLQKLTTKTEVPTDYVQIVLDEVNVKELGHQAAMPEEVALDTEITPELQAEGDAREFMRGVQSLRKDMGLEPSDRVTLTIQTSDGGEAVVKQFEAEISKTVGADSVAYGDANGTELKAGEHEFTVEVKKV